MIRFVQTCFACPEQYDAYEGDRIVGYLRLRHGFFSVHCPDPSGVEVYQAMPEGDGIFASAEERDYYLKFATAAIEKWLQDGEPTILAKPSPPDVAYEIVSEDGSPIDFTANSIFGE